MMNKRFGVIGVGTWGQNHTYVYSHHPGAMLAAVCDKNEERAQAIADQYGATKVYTDYADLLADPDIDAVSIATPDFVHREIAVSAAQAGKDMLLEKPLATTVEDAAAIAKAVNDAGVRFMLDFHNHWNPNFYQAKTSIEEGEIGEPHLIYGRLNDTIFVPTEMLSWADQSAIIWFTGSHLIDLACWLADSAVVKVYCVARSKVLKGMGIDTPDFYETVLEFANGGVAVLESCWTLPNSQPVVIDFNMEVIGTDGAMHIDCSHHQSLRKYTDTVSYPDVFVTYPLHDEIKGLGVASIHHFADCVINDKRPVIGLQEGLANTRIICAALESAETGQPVTLD